MKPHFIIAIINADETKYNKENGNVFQPISMIYYEFQPNEDGTVGYNIGILDNQIEGTIKSVEGESLPATLEEAGINTEDWVQPLAEQIASRFSDDEIVFSLMGYEPDKNETAPLALYNLSADIADEVVSDFYESLKNADRDDEVNYDRVLKWMEKVKNNGARNTPGTMTAILMNKDNIPQINSPAN